MDFLVDNWFIIVGILAVFVVAAAAIYKFAGLPTKEQMNKVKKWMLWAVTKAESQFGSGTGALKLQYVYDMFIDKFPVVAKCITFEQFSLLVDMALEEMRKMLEENQDIARLVLDHAPCV
ncbi:MAG: phage holin, LLH family [Eisenbergiella sp.]